jgi:hypothetical protein
VIIAINASRMSQRGPVAARPPPTRGVKDCADFLEPGGILCFSTLEIDSWAPRLLGRRWPWLMDMHVQYFDRHVIGDMLSRAGFELIRVEPFTHYARLAYALNGVVRMLPTTVERPVSALTRLLPQRLILPVALGDIKLFAARKRPLA